mgnify:CR=1 FL=1
MQNRHIDLFLESRFKFLSLILAFSSSTMQFLGISLIYPFIIILFELNANNDLINELLNYLKYLNFPITKYWLLFYCGSCIALSACLSFFYRIVISYSSFNYLGRLRKKILDYFLKSKFQSSSDSLSKFKNSIVVLSFESHTTLLNQYNIIEKVFTIIFLALLAINFSVLILLLTISVALLIFLFFSFTLKIVRRIQNNLNTTNEKLINLSDSITKNFKYIKSLGNKNFLPTNISSFINKFNSQNFKFTVLNKFTKIFREPIVLISLIIIFYLGLEKFKIDLATLIITFVIMRRLFAQIMELVVVFQSYNKSYAAHKYCKSFLDQIEKDKEISGSIILPEIKNINLKNINLTFDRPIFKNLNLNFKKNNSYLLKGDSGTGKTTLMMILMGIYQIDSGEIIFNENHIQDLNLMNLRTKFSYIDQQNSIFDISLRDNLKIKNDSISDEKILDILKDFNLNYEKKDLDKTINETISNFSGGQIQRLNFIREIISGSDVFIFDEFTSNLDQENTRLIINYIQKKMRDRIIIISSHQKEYNKIVDYIINFDNQELSLQKNNQKK